MSTTEARELSLVGKVELKIALASSDKALDALLKTYLPPLLLKLESEHASVRNKVISICQHLKTRLETPYVTCEHLKAKLSLPKLDPIACSSSALAVQSAFRPPGAAFRPSVHTTRRYSPVRD